MSKLFRSKPHEAEGEKDDLPLLSELQPEIEAEVQRVDALPLAPIGRGDTEQGLPSPARA
jgi:hypothetical protein